MIYARLTKQFIVENSIDILGLLFVSAFLIFHLPIDVLNSLPATGGDMGSHFWPLYVLKNEGVPYLLKLLDPRYLGEQSLYLRLWNPGNLGGEPVLLHYFPLPFMIMAVMGFFLDLGTAFNIGTMLPVFMLPFCVYFCMQQMDFKFPTPILTAVLILPHLYNESYSMFGGNTLSTLSGQFAHLYAICFLLLGIGCLFKNIKKNHISVAAICFFSATALSHAYVFVIIPVFFLSILVFAKKQQLFNWLKILTITGLTTLLLSLWFLWPMMDHHPWTTPVSMYFGKKALIDVFTSKALYPTYIICFIGLITMAVAFFQKKDQVLEYKHLLFWMIPALAYLGLFFVFPKMGLVDSRVIPQMTLFLCISSGILYSFIGYIYFPKKIFSMLILPVALLIMWWTSSHMQNFSYWSQWNYSGWQDKKYYPNLQKLYKETPPGFSKPRIIFEHNLQHNATGTPRVFEMLPYFASRATLEGLYAEANLLSPTSYYMQAKVSKAPSCPITGYICPPYGIESLAPKLNLMGIGHIIVLTDESKEKIRQADYLTEEEGFDPWTLYHLKDPPSLADPIYGFATLIEKEDDWRHKMNKWFDQYDGKNQWQLLALDSDTQTFKTAIENNSQEECETNVVVDFFGFDLQTSCVGVPHVVKFAYHPSWKTSTNDPIYLMSPGLIGIVPSQSHVRFDFGQSFSWRLATFLSIITFFIGLPFIYRRNHKKIV